MERVLTKKEIEKYWKREILFKKYNFFGKKIITVLTFFINRFFDNEPQSIIIKHIFQNFSKQIFVVKKLEGALTVRTPILTW